MFELWTEIERGNVSHIQCHGRFATVSAAYRYAAQRGLPLARIRVTDAAGIEYPEPEEAALVA